MELLYNGRFLAEDGVRLPLTNRAFQYNDGFFETLILENGKLRLWHEHQARMHEAASALKLNLSSHLLGSDFERLAAQLAQKNRCGTLARLKMKVWRAGEGLYTPQTDQTDWLVTAQPAQKPFEEPLHVGICQTVRTIPSAFSSFKGVNSPVYVLASREKAGRNLPDVLLLDPLGHVAELTHSNLFWAEGKTLFTPALATGCLNGVMRRHLFHWAKAHGWAVQEVLSYPRQLLQADTVFAGNVTGLRSISKLEEELLPHNAELMRTFKNSVFK